MPLSIGRQVSELRKLTTGELRTRYAELFGESTASRHRDWLVKRIGWRMQAVESGDLSERARRRAEELANDADLRLYEPRTKGERVAIVPSPAPAPRDERIPPPGSIIRRNYMGTMLEVEVAADGFIYDGEHYPTISAVAQAVTGSHCNGFHFFRLGGGK